MSPPRKSLQETSQSVSFILPYFIFFMAFMAHANFRYLLVYFSVNLPPLECKLLEGNYPYSLSTIIYQDLE